MTWIESHQTLGRHPKLARLARSLGVGKVAAVGHLHFFWWWSLDYSREGDVSHLGDEEIAAGAEWEGDPATFVAAMIAAGFIDPERRVHDWEDYAGKLLDQRRKNAARQRTFRERHKDEGESNGYVTVTDALPVTPPPVTVTPSETLLPVTVTVTSPLRNGLPYPTVPNQTVPTEPDRSRSRSPDTRASASADAHEDGGGKMTPARWSATWKVFQVEYGKAPPRALEARWPQYCPDDKTWQEILAGLARWTVSRAWALDNPNGDFVTKAETWLADKMYLLHPAPANPERANEELEGHAGGDAATRKKVYALGDNDDPYWAENHGLLSEVRKRKRDLAAGLAVPDDGRTGVGGTVPAVPGRRVAQA